MSLVCVFKLVYRLAFFNVHWIRNLVYIIIRTLRIMGLVYVHYKDFAYCGPCLCVYNYFSPYLLGISLIGSLVYGNIKVSLIVHLVYFKIYFPHCIFGGLLNRSISYVITYISLIMNLVYVYCKHFTSYGPCLCAENYFPCCVPGSFLH